MCRVRMALEVRLAQSTPAQVVSHVQIRVLPDSTSLSTAPLVPIAQLASIPRIRAVWVGKRIVSLVQKASMDLLKERALLTCVWSALQENIQHALHKPARILVTIVL